MSFKKGVFPLTCAAVLLFSLSACSAAPEKAEQKPVEKVNGAVITKAQLDRTVSALVGQNPSGQQLPPEQMKKVTDAALEQLTSAELLYQEAAKTEIKDLDKQVEQKFAQNRAKFPTEEEFKKALAGYHMTADEMKEAMRKEIILNTFISKEFVAKTAVTDAEAQKFYEDNLDKIFKKGERLKASHILVSVDQKSTAEEKKKAHEKAETLLKRVKGGEDFAEVAKKESTCPSAARGGDLGEFGKGQMAPPFEKAAFNLKPGEISSVVETEFGYHVIKLAEKLPPATQKFDEVKGKIVEFLTKDKVKKALASHVAELKSKAKIEKL